MGSFLQEVLEQKASVSSSEFEFPLVLTLDLSFSEEWNQALKKY